jgi:hypothetical protein
MRWLWPLEPRVQFSFLAILGKGSLVVADIFGHLVVVVSDRSCDGRVEISGVLVASWIKPSACYDVVIESPWYSRSFAVIQLCAKLADHSGNMGVELVHG